MRVRNDFRLEAGHARQRGAQRRVRLAEELVLGNQQQRRRLDCVELRVGKQGGYDHVAGALRTIHHLTAQRQPVLVSGTEPTKPA
jgi:hypothetical protein